MAFRKKLIGVATAGLVSAVVHTARGQKNEETRVVSTTGAELRFYIGTYTRTGSKGIYGCRLDVVTGKIELTGQTAEVTNPSFLTFDPAGDRLYAVSEAGRDGAVNALAVDRKTGELEVLNQQLSHGSAPCYLSVDATGKSVLVANYSSGTVALLPVKAGGVLGEATSVIQHEGSGPNERRQKGPHAHSITVAPGNRFAIAADLGIDTYLVYRLDVKAGKLVPNDPPGTASPAGAGPRHIAFHPNGRFVYGANELASTVSAFRWDGTAGTLAIIQTVTMLPAEFDGRNSAADIHVHPSGRCLYASNRGHDSIAVYEIDQETGELSLVQHQSTLGKTPRNFAIDPTGRWLLAANQDTDNIAVLAIDPGTGKLSATEHGVSVPMPVCVCFAPVPAFAFSHGPRTPGLMTGGGNFDNGKADAQAETRFGILEKLGAGACRINLYPAAYLEGRKWDTPKAHALDKIMERAHAHGVTPLLLFEYYAHYYQTEGLGTEEQWFNIGKAFAERYRPNGTWARERGGIRDYGICVYTAMNEPEGTDFGQKGKLGPDKYVAALRGLGNGVHSVDPHLVVAPGGFKNANAFCDWKLDGIGPALAPLYNAGILDAVDLHTYCDIQYAPMEKGYRWSAQNNFDEVKKACGITADVWFISTEFNYKRREVTEDEAAKGFLTAIWDNLGVVKNDGSTPATLLAFPWNIFHLSEKDGNYGLCESVLPWKPTRRGEVLRMVLELTDGMAFTRFDPKGTGTFVLESPGRKLWVWQNRKGWTKSRGTTFAVEGIPAGATVLEVYGWDGLRKTVPVAGRDTIALDGLPEDETSMFVAK